MHLMQPKDTKRLAKPLSTRVEEWKAAQDSVVRFGGVWVIGFARGRVHVHVPVGDLLGIA